MSCATQKSLAAGHIMSFQIHPSRGGRLCPPAECSDFTIIFGEFVNSQRADVGIGPYANLYVSRKPEGVISHRNGAFFLLISDRSSIDFNSKKC